MRRGVFAGGRGWFWLPWFVLEWVLKPYRQTLAIRHSLDVGFWSWCVSAAYVLLLLTVPPLRRVTFGSCPKSNQKVLPLASGSRCARLPSFHHCSRGRRTRAIPGPLRLSPHPCGSLPSTTIPLGLLNGAFGVVCEIAGEQQKNGGFYPLYRLRTRRSGPWPRCFGLCSAFAFRSAVHKSPKQRGPRIPSGGRVEVVWRGAFGMDAKRGMSGHGWPVLPTLGTVPERGELSAAKPGCRVCFLFGYFLFAQAKRK